MTTVGFSIIILRIINLLKKHDIDVTLGIVAEANKYEIFLAQNQRPEDSNLNYNLNLGK